MLGIHDLWLFVISGILPGPNGVRCSGMPH
jgi:hypothetical protein